MKWLSKLIILGFALFLPTLAYAAPNMHAASLPDSRSVAVGDTASVFAVISNTGDTSATNCRIELSPFTTFAGTILYQTTDGANLLTGTADTPVDIAAGTSQTFYVALTPSSQFGGTVVLSYACDDSVFAPGQPGVNDIRLLAQAGTPADILTIISTPSDDGVLRAATSGGIEAAGMAALNFGGGGDVPVTVSPNMSNFADLADLSICETDSGGNCLAPATASVDTTIGSSAKTFSIFADAPDGGGVGLLPGYTRIGVEIVERAAGGDKPQTSRPMADGDVLGATSVAWTAPAPASSSGIPAGIFNFQIRDQINDPSGEFLGEGQMVIAEDGTTLGWIKRIDTTPFLQVFQANGDYFPDNPGTPLFGGDLSFLEATNNTSSYEASLTFSYDKDSSFLGTYSYTPPTDVPTDKVTISKPEFLHVSNFLTYLGQMRIALTVQQTLLSALVGDYNVIDPLTGTVLGTGALNNEGLFSATLTPPGFVEGCVFSAGLTPAETLGIITLVDIQMAQCGLPAPTAALAFQDPLTYGTVTAIRMIMLFDAVGMVLDMQGPLPD